MAATVYLRCLAKNQLPVAASCSMIHTSSSRRDRIRNIDPASLKRGTGGRSSFSGMVATVFGSSGFIGRYVCNRLGKIGTQLILPYRCDAQEMLRLRLTGDLGQVLFQPFHLEDEESIRKAMRYSNVVINLIGRDWETKNFTFKDVHVDGAKRIARIAREMCMPTFVHVSALNASPDPECFVMPEGSKFLKSKFYGECAVLDEFPDAIVFRPADVYGPEDRFIRYLCNNWRHQGKWLPMYMKGEVTEKQPVYVSDLAAGIVAACKDRDARGKVFQAVGPKRYLLSELVDWFHRLTRKSTEWGYRRYDMRWDPVFRLKVSLLPNLTMGWPVGNLHWERLEREIHSDQVDPTLPTLEDLGVTLTHMEDQVPWEIKPYRAYAYYEKEFGELEYPEPPKVVATQ